jgi:hypothetical protein
VKLFEMRKKKDESKNISKNRKSRKRGFLIVLGTVFFVLLLVLGFYLGNKIYTNIKMEEAAEYANNEQYQEAIELYTYLLERDVDNIEAEKELKKSYVSLCENLLEDNKFMEALNIAKQGHEVTKYSKLMNLLEMIESGEIENEDGKLSKKIIYTEAGKVQDFTIYVYFKNGKLKREEHYNNLNEMEKFETFDYDYEYRLSNKMFFYAKGNELYYEEKYDKNGELEEIINYNSDGNINYRETYETVKSNQITTKYFEDGSKTEEIYNSYGSITKTTNWDNDGECIIAEYDSKERLEKELYCDSYGELICYQEYENEYRDGLLRYAYNDYGELQYIYEFDIEGKLYYKYEYDEYESLIKATEYDSEGRESIILWFDYYEDIEQYLSIEYCEQESIYRYYGFDFFYDEYLMYYDVYEYDEDGKELKMTSFYGDGSLAYYYNNEYDGLGHIQMRYDFDGMGKSDGWVEYICDEKGNPLKASYYGPNEDYYGMIERTFDENGNIIKIETSDEQDRLYAFVEYVYDKDGYEIKNYVEE